MTFLWPKLLWLLALVPLVTAAYVWTLRRKRRRAAQYASFGLLGKVGASATPRWRRTLPPALLLVAFTAMCVALARPAAVMNLPSPHKTILMAMDVSGSMKAGDVQPTRLAAAQAAAKSFIADLPSSTEVGIVAFAAAATLVQPPTDRHDDLVAAIDRFQSQRGTAVGSGILVALKAIFPDIQFDLQSSNPRGAGAKKGPRGMSLDAGKGGDGEDRTKMAAPGSYGSAAIILLTDGQTTTGPDPIEAARMAAERGVKVFTVGVGTAKGETLRSEGWSMRVRLDEDALKTIANLTRGEYFYAGTAPDLKKIYQSLNNKLIFEKRELEVTGLFAGGAALLALLAAALSMLWFNRIL